MVLTYTWCVMDRSTTRQQFVAKSVHCTLKTEEWTANSEQWTLYTVLRLVFSLCVVCASNCTCVHATYFVPCSMLHFCLSMADNVLAFRSFAMRVGKMHFMPIKVNRIGKSIGHRRCVTHPTRWPVCGGRRWCSLPSLLPSAVFSPCSTPQGLGLIKA